MSNKKAILYGIFAFSPIGMCVISILLVLTPIPLVVDTIWFIASGIFTSVYLLIIDIVFINYIWQNSNESVAKKMLYIMILLLFGAIALPYFWYEAIWKLREDHSIEDKF